MNVVHRLGRSIVRFEDTPNACFMVLHNSDSSFLVEVDFKQHLYQPLMEFKELVLSKLIESFSMGRGMLSCG